MSSFDQRGQQIGGNQYNADNITFNQQVVSPTMEDTHQRGNRQKMLKGVRNFWIKGVLKKSLQEAAPIALKLRQQENADANPWSTLLQESNQGTKELPPGTRITQVYDEGGKLLILGEPGSGKTTLLLELADELLNRAEHDDTEPIPAVFLLSSWVRKQQPLTEWLVEELENKYEVRGIGRSWIENDQLLPLLDGLDEVPSQHRMTCIHAINDYQKHHLSPIVCSRSSDYFALATPLMLNYVIVQPLTEQQSEDYLLHLGEQATEIRLAFQTDPLLKELATTPLILSILTQAYQGKPIEELLAADSSRILRQQIFTTYVESMLHRRGSQKRYGPHKTTYWLTYLAQQMLQQNQTAFFIEQMQPNWLSSSRLQQLYVLFAVRIPDIVIGILISILISNLLFTEKFSVPSTLIYGITGGLIGGLIGRKKQRIPSTEGNNHLWRPFLRDLVAARHFDVGLLIGLSYGIVYGLSYGIVYGLSYGIVYGCMSILLSVILERSKLSTSSPLLTRWSWQSLWSHFIASGYLRNGLLVGVTYSTGYVLSTEIVHQFHLTQIPITQTDVAANTLVYILNYTLIGILLSIIIEGRQTTIQPAEILVWSWRNLWDNLVNVKRLRNGLLLGLLVGTIIEVCDLIRLGPGTSTLELGLNAVPIFGLAYWLLLGLLILLP